MSFDISLNSLYICVKDMERAIHFYERFFEQPASVRDEVFSIFDIKGFRFCLFNNQKVNESVKWGDNCLPSFEVNDMDRLLEKLLIMNFYLKMPSKKRTTLLFQLRNFYF